MDQLETLVLPSETVKVGEQSFEVQGLALAHITRIIREHRSVCAELYTKAIGGELTGSVEEIALGMADDFAPLAAMVIACGSGNPKAADKASRLPLSVQVDALEKIINLTLVAEGGLEKLMEIVVRAMAGAASLTSLKA
ncbi:hypothetical protein EM858_14640 [Agrobacterium sp. CNPSo 2736]|uniref:phage pre-tape measure protein n=1 Tax=Agrobacterium sp. CNPSo 2736 TaxID=2499627 RepID=UPI000FDB5A81|nr:hypothetical protein [Agrobacterium sp. CNPSo 2736]RVT75681.1 hypothetical protein EM858_14640 [Agrobacterium sp. CNPSo 2736]